MKSPTDGNNYIIYDFSGNSSDLNNVSRNGNGYDLAGAQTISNTFDYSLLDGNDKLEITGSLQNSLKNIYVLGGAGDDLISGATLVDGGDGNDEIITFSTANSNQLKKTEWNGSQTIWDTLETTRIAGGKGDDTITAGSKSLIGVGGSGADIINGSTQKDIIWGDNWDYLRPNLSPDAQDFYFTGTSYIDIYGQLFENRDKNGDGVIDGVIEGNDTISTGLGDDEIYAGGGDDTVSAGAGTDLIYGGSGNDTLDGGEGNNRIFGQAGR